MPKATKSKTFKYVAHVVIASKVKVSRKRVRVGLIEELGLPDVPRIIMLGNGAIGEIVSVRANVDHD